jgi:hypothetical protein
MGKPVRRGQSAVRGRDSYFLLNLQAENQSGYQREELVGQRVTNREV